jgi:hypothetical protein
MGDGAARVGLWGIFGRAVGVAVNGTDPVGGREALAATTSRGILAGFSQIFPDRAV